MFQESFKDGQKNSEGCLQKFSRVFQESFQGVLRKIEGCFKVFKVVFSRCQGYLKEC